MILKTAYMGEIEIDKKRILKFEHGIPGFEKEREFAFIPIEEDSVFQVLQSIQTENLAFIITSPYAITTNYNFELDEATLKALDIKSENEVAVFVIVSLKDTLANSTVNLKAPIVLNTTNKYAKQVILDNEVYTIRHQLSLESIKG
ncbi:flagellar assembly protein FliW [Lysinibacillus fusiformis]|nr:flagellar assembly protein FliW [Lysinibacillus fusiformis]